MLPLRWSLQAEKIWFYLERRSLFPLCCFWFSFSPQRVRPPARCVCLAHFPVESSFKIKVSGREGSPVRGGTLALGTRRPSLRGAGGRLHHLLFRDPARRIPLLARAAYHAAALALAGA